MTTGREFQMAVARWHAGESLAHAAATLCSALTPGEKLSMLDGDLNFWEGRIRALTLGQSNRTCPAAVIPRLGIPGFDFIDGPRGVGLGTATCFPVSMARGAGFDPALETEIGKAIGKELRVRGGTLFGGVCINLLRHPAWGRAQETYGEDPHHVGEMGAALSQGVQHHAMACVKHFALNSMETSRHRVDVTCGERALHEVYLPHFRRVVQSGVATVMSAYNSVNGEWCGHSRALLTEILKDEWGFDGTVITDFIFGIRDAAASLKAGVDIEMPYRMIRWQHLPREIAEGRVTWAEVDATVQRILRTLIRFAHLRQQPMPDAAIVAGPAHTELALKSARQSIVLMENDGVLPLSSATGRIAVLGRLAAIPNLGDGGSSAVNPPHVVTPLDGIIRGFPKAQVTHSEDDATTAKDADLAIVVVGTTMHDEGEFLDLDAQLPMLDLYAPPFESDDQRQRFQFLIENQHTALADPPGGDRASLKLSSHDRQLILDAAATGVPVVVVMMGGSAFVTEGWRDRVRAILHLWYPGMEGGTALADVLSGRVNPSGHMPFATPVDEALLPPFALLTVHADYGLLHGQWHMDESGYPVRYPFGHGLTYSGFRPLALTVEAGPAGALARVEWKNTGTAAGDDVIFIFASVPGSACQRPKRRLVGFRRISLCAGEAATTAIPLDLRQLAIRSDGRWLWEDLALRIEAARWSGDPQAVVWSGKVESPRL
ncbi:MAG: glycoside hydrolase family 3 C-terminal domain-containing protein [Rhodobacter sp.]|nr:glycoside hydrolase family 3 C-terminal domain-containing protein [Rhodobacter sp.]